MEPHRIADVVERVPATIVVRDEQQEEWQRANRGLRQRAQALAFRRLDREPNRERDAGERHRETRKCEAGEEHAEQPRSPLAIPLREREQREHRAGDVREHPQRTERCTPPIYGAETQKDRRPYLYASRNAHASKHDPGRANPDGCGDCADDRLIGIEPEYHHEWDAENGRDGAFDDVMLAVELERFDRWPWPI